MPNFNTKLYYFMLGHFPEETINSFQARPWFNAYSNIAKKKKYI